MIVFKQKEYVLQALGGIAGVAGLGLTAAGTAVSAIQGHNANAANEEAAEIAAKEQKRHNKAMEEAAKQNPALANEVERKFSSKQKNYAFIPASVTKAATELGKTKAGTFAKDMYGMYGGGMKKAAAMGAGFAAIGYAGNKMANMWKKSDEGRGDENKKTLLKAAGTAAAVGGGILAARRGLLSTPVQNFMTKGAGGKALSAMKNQVVSTNEAGKINIKGTLGKNAMNGVFMAMPVVSYGMSRGDKNKQIEEQQNSAQQNSYSDNGEKKSGVGKKIALGLGATAAATAGAFYGAKRGWLGTGLQRSAGNMLTKAGNYASKQGLSKVGTKLTESGQAAVKAGSNENAKRTLAQKVSGGFNKIANFMGMSGQNGGTAAVQERATKMASTGIKGDSHEYTRALGNFMNKHKVTANVAGGLALAGAGSVAMGIGDKAVNMPLKALDKETFADQEQKNEKVYSDNTMIRFKEKNYSKVSKGLTAAATTASLGLSAASLATSRANYKTNKQRHENDKVYQEQQLKAMNDLTSSIKRLNQVNTRLADQGDIKNTVEPEKKKSKSRFFKFLQKNNSYTSDYALKGAMIGAGVGGTNSILQFVGKKIGVNKVEGQNKEYLQEYYYDDKKGQPKSTELKSRNKIVNGGLVEIPSNDTTDKTTGVWGKNNRAGKTARFIRSTYNNSDPAVKSALISLGCTAIGAALGAIAGLIKDTDEFINKKNVNSRLLPKVEQDLKKIGFKEGKDYVKDPKKADMLKCRVCLVISGNSDSFRLVINTQSDRKLQNITEESIKYLPSMSTVTKKITDRFNEVNIASLSSQNSSTFIASIAEKFIREGYPVYLVEVG